MPEDDHAPPPRAEDFSDTDRVEGERKKLFERAVPEILKRVIERAIESGATRLAEGPENLRNMLQELKLPKEVLHYLYQQIDETKNDLYRVAAKEIRDVLQQTQFADELTKVLTKLSFEIKTEIRFIPNDAATGAAKKDDETSSADAAGKLPKPEIVTHVAVRDKGRDKEGRR